MLNKDNKNMSGKSIVITGGTRGIGYGLAKKFLGKNCSVTVCGTTKESVERALQDLAPAGGRAYGAVADVSRREDVEALFATAAGSTGQVDIWVNNAGIGQENRKIWELDPAEVERVLRVNLLGVVNGTVVPFLAMRERGGGRIFNMEGLGSDGFVVDGMAVYGASKSAMSYFTRAFAHEARDSSVSIGLLSPGMVVTDLLLDSMKDGSPESVKRKKFYNIMADDVDTVAAFLCDKILASTERSPKIRWLTKTKMLSRMLLAPFRKRDLFA